MRRVKLPSEYYPCKCLKPQEYRDQANTCIKFRPEHGTFHILYNDLFGETWTGMMFCPFCGGRPLKGRYECPKDRLLRNKEKLLETTLKQRIKSLDDAYRILGKPDKIMKHWRYEKPSENANFDVFEINEKTSEGNENKFVVFIHPKNLAPITKL